MSFPLAAMLSMLTFFAFAQEQVLDQNKAIEYYQRGSEQLQLQNYKQAIALINSAIAFNRINPDYYYARGLAYYRSEDFETARKDFSKAVEMDPKQANYYYYLGSIYQKLGDLEQSTSHYQLAIERNSDSYMKIDEVNALSHMGVNHIKQKSFDKAIGVFDQLIEKDPDNKSAYLNRGIAEGSLRRVDEACRDFARAKELGSTAASTYSQRYCSGIPVTLGGTE
ncbi:MAG: tetratricopeptide repeat protein [Bacteroidota bacterium]